MDCTVRESNPGAEEIFRTSIERSRPSPTLLYNRYQFFHWVKNGRGLVLTNYRHVAGSLPMGWGYNSALSQCLHRQVMGLKSPSRDTKNNFLSLLKCHDKKKLNAILPKGQELEKRRYGTSIRSSTVMLLKTAQNQFSTRLSATTCSY